MASDPILLPTCLLELKDDLPIVRLPHPRTRRPALFAIRAGQGVWEIQAVASRSRSWFFEPLREDQPDQLLSQHAGRLLVVTPFDPFFLLLGLFLGHLATPFDGPEKNTDHHARFEDIDTIFERTQEHWLFADTTEGPTPGDVELFTREAFQDQHLARIFASLQQEGREDTLWRPDPARIVREITRKVDRLATVGREAGRAARTVWTRLAAKEGLFSVDETPDNLPVINQIFQKVALEMVQACLPTPISAHLRGLSAYDFALLRAEKERQAGRPRPDPLEIGSRPIPQQGAQKPAAKPPPAKRKKTDDSARPAPKLTLHNYFRPSPAAP